MKGCCHMSSVCGICELSVGVYVSAAITIFTATVSICLSIWTLVFHQYWDMAPSAMTALVIGLVLALVLCAFWLLSVILLLIAVYKTRRKFVLPWMMLTTMLMFYIIACVCIALAFSGNVCCRSSIGIFVVSLVVSTGIAAVLCYCLVMVGSYYQDQRPAVGPVINEHHLRPELTSKPAGMNRFLVTNNPGTIAKDDVTNPTRKAPGKSSPNTTRKPPSTTRKPSNLDSSTAPGGSGGLPSIVPPTAGNKIDNRSALPEED